jgi:Ca2+-binding RTX toxin-like protein
VAGEESEAVEGEMRPREARRARMRKMGLLLAVMAVGLVVASGAALAATINCAGDCSGTNDPDRLIGSTASQTMLGLDGGDSISGYRGDDDVEGGAGGDAVYGGLGDDRVLGGTGNDYVEGDYGHDNINTGTGSDKVAAKDGYRDRITCGQGRRDKVYKDKKDRTQGCEIKLSQKPRP